MKTIILFFAAIIISCASVTAQIAAQGGYALEFDGSNDYVTTGANLVNLANDMTVEAWFKTTNATGYNSIVTIEKTASGINDYLQILTNSSGKVYLDDANDATIFTTTESYNDGNWHHVAFVRNASIKTIYLYVDGVLKLSRAYTYSGSIDPDHELRFGNSEYQGGSYQMDGMIDEVRIWSDVRTEAEIKANMYKELQGDEAGLEGYYNMNGGAGTSLADNSINSNTGTLVNGPMWKLSGCFGGSRQALDFDGNNDYVFANLNSSFSNVLTIETYIYFKNLTNQQNFIHINDGGVNRRIVPYKDPSNVINLFAADASNNADVVSTNYVVEANVWYHIAFVYNNRQVYIYINGELYADEVMDYNYSLDGSDRLYFAADWGTGFLSNIKLDEVRIWNTARTQAQIQENMMKTLAGNEPGLVAYYRFDQYNGTILYDMTSNGNDGTLTNMDASDWVSSNAFNTWIGAEDNSWTNADNWTNGAPATGQSLGLYNTSNGNDFEFSSALNYGSIYLSNVNSLSLNNNADLTLSGNIINNGIVTIESNALGDGSLITNAISGSGNYNVERYLSANTWHLVTSPITAGTAGVFNGIWLRPYDELTNQFGAYIVPDNTPMPTGEGFSVWTNNSETRTFNGTINNTSVTKTLQRSPDGGDVLNFGWNLIGNPYPCAIDLDAASGWTKNNVGRAVYVWDGGLSGGQYRVYLAATGTEQGIAANGGSRYVAMGQGFFVQAIADGATITMDKPIRVHNSIEFRDAEIIPDMININVAGNGYSDESVIYYKAEADENFDFDYDAAKLYGASAAPQLYTKKQDNLLTINAINDFDELNGKFVYLEVGAAGEYMLEFTHSLIGYAPVLKDLFTDQYIYPGENYVFTATPDDNPQRFQFSYDLTGISDETANDISVWAFENVLRVEPKNGEAIDEISIYSIQGQLLMKFTEIEKDLSGLAPAVYIVKVSVGNEVKIDRVVVR